MLCIEVEGTISIVAVVKGKAGCGQQQSAMVKAKGHQWNASFVGISSLL